MTISGSSFPLCKIFLSTSALEHKRINKQLEKIALTTIEKKNVKKLYKSFHMNSDMQYAHQFFCFMHTAFIINMYKRLKKI